MIVELQSLTSAAALVPSLYTNTSFHLTIKSESSLHGPCTSTTLALSLWSIVLSYALWFAKAYASDRGASTTSMHVLLALSGRNSRLVFLCFIPIISATHTLQPSVVLNQTNRDPVKLLILLIPYIQ